MKAKIKATGEIKELNLAVFSGTQVVSYRDSNGIYYNTYEVLSLSMDYINNHDSYGDPVPTIEGLACELFISRNTLYRWAEEQEGLS